MIAPTPEHQAIVHRWFFDLGSGAQIDLLDELVAPTATGPRTPA